MNDKINLQRTYMSGINHTVKLFEQMTKPLIEMADIQLASMNKAIEYYKRVTERLTQMVALLSPNKEIVFIASKYYTDPLFSIYTPAIDSPDIIPNAPPNEILKNNKFNELLSKIFDYLKERFLAVIADFVEDLIKVLLWSLIGFIVHFICHIF